LFRAARIGARAKERAFTAAAAANADAAGRLFFQQQLQGRAL